MLRVFAIVVALTQVLLSGCQSGPVFVRTAAGPAAGGVEAAWSHFRPPPGRPRVSLLSMVHVGERGFFERVQAELDRADVVLMEGIVRAESLAAEPQKAAKPRIGGDLFALAHAFRLVHQVEVLRAREHFVPADMGEAEFRELVAASPETEGASLRDLQKDASFEVFRYLQRHPACEPEVAEETVRTGVARRHLVRAVAASVARGDTQPDLGRRRTEIALRAVDRCAADQQVVLCWGYVHGEDLCRGLTERGYTLESQDWQPVFGYQNTSAAPRLP